MEIMRHKIPVPIIENRHPIKPINIESGKVVATGLNFLGIVAISDPIRTDVPDAVTECMKAGIKVKIVTGDTTGTAIEIGRQIGLWSNNDNEKHIITGPEFAKLSDSELDDIVLDLKIIARARPMNKQRLVESLQRKNRFPVAAGLPQKHQEDLLQFQ